MFSLKVEKMQLKLKEAKRHFEIDKQNKIKKYRDEYERISEYTKELTTKIEDAATRQYILDS